VSSRFLFLLLIFILVSCGSPPPAQNAAPPPTSEPTIEADISSEEHRLISVRLDEIRLAPGIANRAIPLDTVWIIPLNTSEEVTARMQYVEDAQNIIIRDGDPYIPTSPWFISIERENLANENFGLWFVVAHVGDNSLISREDFNQLLKDVGIVIASGTVGAILTAVTPGLPEEIIPATVTIVRGRAVLSTLSILGRNFAREIPGMGSVLTERELDNIFDASANLDDLLFFSELYVIVSATDDYYLNNQISAITADGSLEIVFSIFETDNVDSPNAAFEFVPPAKRSDIFPPVVCNPSQPSRLQAGVQARVVQSTVNVFANVLGDEQVDFRLRGGEIVTTIYSYCDTNNQVLWWRIRTERGELGFVAESTVNTINLEPITDE
jgi:hypothetical protein